MVEGGGGLGRRGLVPIVLLLGLLLGLVLLCACCYLDVLFCEYTDYASSYFVMNDCLVIFAYDVYAEFLCKKNVGNSKGKIKDNGAYDDIIALKFVRI